MALVLSTLRRPDNPQIVDPSTGRMRDDWALYFAQLTSRVNAAVGAAPGLAGGLGFVIDGGGSVLTTGAKGSLYVPIGYELTAGRLLADQAGDIEIDIWLDTGANYPPTVADSITGSAPLTLSSGDYSEDTTLAGWTTTISAGSVLYFNINSVSDIKRIEIALTGNKT